jgi:hypothetical protein
MLTIRPKAGGKRMIKSLKRICMFRHSDDVHIDGYDDMDRHFRLADNVTLVTATTHNRRAAEIVG